MLLIGLLYLAFRELIPVEQISAYSELIVGFVLIGIGIWAILKALMKLQAHHHQHPHLHADPEPYVHIHPHDHADETQHQHTHQKAHRQNRLAALSVGTLHGFAGISHFLLILPTLMLPSLSESVIYLSGFAAGTIGAMLIYALILGIAAQRVSNLKENKVFRNLRIAAGILAILVGIYWIAK
jgi:ABC-type nickel/cobalt efflux system permease component RcnA